MAPYLRRRQTTDQHLDINEGTVSFRILPGKVDFSDGKDVLFWTGSPEGGELRIAKDVDGRITFTHLKHGEGRTVAAHSVPLLDPAAAHRVGASWSISEGKIDLYLDGVKVATATIAYV